MRKNSAVFDFDGTLISVNSFPRWVIFLLYKSIFSFNAGIAYSVFILLFKRKIIKEISHEQFKFELALLPIPDIWLDIFARTLLPYRRSAVWSKLLSHISNDDITIISSAAYKPYLDIFFKISTNKSYDKITIIGSHKKRCYFFDNYKENKVKELLNLNILSGKEIDYLYSDSWDDVFLARISKEIHLIAPKSADLEKYLAAPELSNRTYIHWK